MRPAIRMAQVAVALLLIASGLIKANDPLGLSYKMQEFFELWGTGLARSSFFGKALDLLHKSSLSLSVFMISLEIVTGVALLVGWMKKPVLWTLLVLAVFFTFLTGYAYLSGRFTNCGCFGDCLPISPLTSFFKDLALLALIVFLFPGHRHMARVGTGRTQAATVVLGLVLGLAIQWYALQYLPVADCLPFKKGASIVQGMKPPPGSRPDSIVIKYVYEKGGKRFEWSADELPADFTTYKYVDRIDKVVRKGNAEPPIKGFSLVGLTGEDSTQIVLQQRRAVLVFALDFSDRRWIRDMKDLVDAALTHNVPVYLSSTNLTEGLRVFAQERIAGVQFFNTDFTVVRTVARTTPTVLFLEAGTVRQKFGRHGLNAAGTALVSP